MYRCSASTNTPADSADTDPSVALHYKTTNIVRSASVETSESTSALLNPTVQPCSFESDWSSADSAHDPDSDFAPEEA